MKYHIIISAESLVDLYKERLEDIIDFKGLDDYDEEIQFYEKTIAMFEELDEKGKDVSTLKEYFDLVDSIYEIINGDDELFVENEGMIITIREFF